MYDAFDRVLKSVPRPDHLVVETSGVADPGKIAQIAIAEPELELFGVVTLVDVVNFDGLLADPFLSDTARRQARAAAMIALTKTDLCPQEQTKRLVAQLERIATGAAKLVAEHGNVPFELLLGRLQLGEEPGEGCQLMEKYCPLLVKRKIVA